jgi:hypothetical protein
MGNFKEWIKTDSAYNELNFKDGGDFKHSLAAIAAAMGGGLAGSAIGGMPGGIAGFLAGKTAMTRFYPATGKNMRKMEK